MGKTFVIPCSLILIFSILAMERCDAAFYYAVGAILVMVLAIYKDWLDDKRRENDARLNWKD